MKRDHTALRRFWAKVDQPDFDGCWEWTASKQQHGYGRLRFRGKAERAHRVSYILHISEIPDGMFVCHSCDNPGCVNPNHLWLGKPKDNMDDMIQKGRDRKAVGEKASRVKLTEREVLEIRKKYVPYKYGTYKLASEYCVKPAQIYSIVARKSWSHLKQREEDVVAIPKRLNENQRSEIMSKYSFRKYTAKMLSKEYKVSIPTIYKIIRKRK